MCQTPASIIAIALSEVALLYTSLEQAMGFITLLCGFPVFSDVDSVSFWACLDLGLELHCNR